MNDVLTPYRSDSSLAIDVEVGSVLSNCCTIGWGVDLDTGGGAFRVGDRAGGGVSGSGRDSVGTGVTPAMMPPTRRSPRCSALKAHMERPSQAVAPVTSLFPTS
jgi:hypothetical protein